ncbi:MAG: hypothetical protein ACLRUN_06335 [Christensenellales bacterium]
MHRILFKRFEKGIRRVHLAMIRPDQQPDALRYHPVFGIRNILISKTVNAFSFWKEMA